MLKRHFVMTLEVTNKDPSFPWVLNWLNAHGSRRTQHLSVNTAMRQSPDGSARLHFDMVPGPGRHLIRYDGRMFLVNRAREHQTRDSEGRPWEKVTLTSFGRDPSIFDSVLLEANAMSRTKEEGVTLVYNRR